MVWIYSPWLDLGTGTMLIFSGASYVILATIWTSLIIKKIRLDRGKIEKKRDGLD
nr:hypothetical protein [Candidatus Sigynarchaeum springense]